VGEVRVDGRALDLDSEAFGSGFYWTERQGDTAWRWTDGEASLTLAAPALVEIALHMTAQSWTRPAAPFLRVVSAS
jgi:hypothetical protein